MLLAAVSVIGVGKVALFLLMLSVLIVLHEYGHFIVARRNGVRVNEFAVGMGPKLLGWTSPRSGTLYSLRALPIGGYCAMQGEDGKTSEAEQQREFQQLGAQSDAAQSDNFQAKSPWARLAIVLAGPVANFILCYAILVIGAFAFGVASQTGLQPLVGTVVAHSPGAVAGIRPGDRILSLDGSSVNGADLIARIHGSLGKRLALVYERDGATTKVDVTPVTCASLVGASMPNAAKMGCIGFTPVPMFVRVGFVEALKQSGEQFVGIADQTVGSLVMLVMHFTQYAPQVSGVIGMGQVATTIQDFGWAPYFLLAATISFALGIFNLLPIPALDGGRAAFIVAEIVRGKPIDPEKEAMVHVAGFAALMALMLLVAFHDIARIFNQNGVM